MRFANYKRVYVATYKEIIIGFITFSLILVVLYPKELIMNQILSEKSNYDLSMLYLKNMLRNDPKNEQLVLTLAQKSIKSKNRDLAFNLLKLLRNSKNRDVQSQAYLISYKIEKENYFYLQAKKEKEKLTQLYKELEKIFLVILKKHFYQQTDLHMLYKEAVFLNSLPSEYILMKEILKQNPNDISMLSDAFYIAFKLKKNEEALLYLDRLSQIDTKHQVKWYDEKYYLLTQVYSYNALETYLLKEAKTSQYWRDKVVDFYLSHKNYKKASNYYMSLFSQTSNFYAKRNLWFKAIDALSSGNFIQDASNLGHKHEAYFLRDKKSRMKLLKLYISADNLNRARELSAKIIKVQK